MENGLWLPQDWKVFDNSEVLAKSLVEKILALAENAIEEGGAFHFITAGGTTPNRCYELLSQANADWQNWHIYMGDERVLHFSNPERNSQALLKYWLNHNDIPANQVHFINTEAGLEKSAQAYATLIEGIEYFDFCMLGMGEDGHTASLFPGHEKVSSIEEVGENRLIIMERDSPKPPAERVSLNYSAFLKCKSVLKVISGASKQGVMRKWLEGSSDFPIAKVKGQKTSVWASRDALGGLKT